MWIWCKSVQWFLRYFTHKRKSHTQCQKQNLTQFTACGNHKSTADISTWQLLTEMRRAMRRSNHTHTACSMALLCFLESISSACSACSATSMHWIACSCNTHPPLIHIHLHHRLHCNSLLPSQSHHISSSIRSRTETFTTRMWANAQRDGRPAEHRWRPLFNDAKFGWCPLLDCCALTLPRRKSRWN